MRHFLAIGLTGMAIFLAVNIYALMALERASARPFTPEWWAEWFPAVGVWLVFLVVGVGQRLFTRAKGFESER